MSAEAEIDKFDRVKSTRLFRGGSSCAHHGSAGAAVMPPSSPFLPSVSSPTPHDPMSTAAAEQSFSFYLSMRYQLFNVFYVFVAAKHSEL